MLPRPARIALSALALIAGSAVAAPLATVTVADGEVALIRDTGRQAAAAGLKLTSDDIVQTGRTARLARIEFADGSALELGPDTQVLLPATGRRAAFVAQGRVRLAVARGRQIAIGTPRMELVSLTGTAVVRVSKDLSAAVVESGRAEVHDRRDAKPNKATALRDGQALVLRGTEPAAVQAGAQADLLDDTTPRSRP